MEHLQSYEINRALPEDSISFYDEDFPGFNLIRKKITKSHFFQVWRGQYKQIIKTPQIQREKANQMQYINIFIDNFRNKMLLKTFFKVWKTVLSQNEEFKHNSNDKLENLENYEMDPKYIEFMTELQESISRQANLQTTLNVLNGKVQEISAVHDQTKTKSEKLFRKCDILSSTYENLLRQLSEMKISHRDHIASLQLQMKNSSSHDLDEHILGDSIFESISLDNTKFMNEKAKIENKIQEEKEHAADLRNQIFMIEDENKKLEDELEQLKTEIESTPDPQHDPYIEPSSKLVELRKLLIQADQQLQTTSVVFKKQTNQIKELDYQLVRLRTTLDNLKTRQNSVLSPRSTKSKSQIPRTPT